MKKEDSRQEAGVILRDELQGFENSCVRSIMAWIDKLDAEMKECQLSEFENSFGR